MSRAAKGSGLGRSPSLGLCLIDVSCESNILWTRLVSLNHLEGLSGLVEPLNRLLPLVGLMVSPSQEIHKFRIIGILLLSRSDKSFGLFAFDAFFQVDITQESKDLGIFGVEGKSLLNRLFSRIHIIQADVYVAEVS